MQHHDLYLLAGAAGGFIIKTLLKWIFGNVVTKGFDWFVQRYILKSERRLWIWLHHKYGHHAHNSLHCEISGCAKVTPLPKHPKVQYE